MDTSFRKYPLPFGSIFEFKITFLPLELDLISYEANDINPGLVIRED